MQLLTAPPRQGLTDDQVVDLIVAADTQWQAGCELVDASGIITDISDDLAGGTVTWDATADDDQDNTGTVYRSCQLQLSRQLAWGRDRVRVYTVATDPATSIAARFNLGTFELNTPQSTPNETPQTYDVTGEDLLGRLAQPIYDSVVMPADNQYAGEVTALIALLDPAAVIRDFSGSTVTIPDDIVYVLSESEQPTWLGIINDLLKAAGCAPLFVDELGQYWLLPLTVPANQPAEWTFNADDPRLTIVSTDRTLTEDVWNAYNAWKFIVSGLSFPPEEGNGMYTPPDNTSDGPTSIDAIGRRNQHTVYLAAADQDALVTQGDAIVAADQRVAATLELKTYPFPLHGHKDIASYVDTALGGTRKLVCTKWVFDLGNPDSPAPADTQSTWTSA